MLRLTLMTLLLAACSCTAAGAEMPLSVEAVIARHLDARGGVDRIKAIRNLLYAGGTYQEGEYRSDGTATMSLARPWFKLVGDKRKAGFPHGYLEGYDGAAWEWFADPGVVLRTVGAASEAIRHYAGVDGPFVDYQRKGSSAVLEGSMELDGRRVHVVRLTRRDGYVEQFYIDDETWLINASSSAAPLHAFGETVSQLTRIEDYREVAGVRFPFRFVTVRVPSGEELSSMQWGTIEADLDLPQDWFSPPSFERTPIAAFIEHLYGQRDDLDAVLWTYHEFRYGWPEVDIVDAVSVAGYQMLKMGQQANAIGLFEQALRDHPSSAELHFQLARASDMAGNRDEALRLLGRALELDGEHERAD